MLNFWKQIKTNAGAAEEHHGALAQGMKAAGEAGAFPHLPESDLIRLFNTATLTKLATGDHLFDAGEVADRLYILIAGRVELKQATDADGEHFGSGDWIHDVGVGASFEGDVTAVALAPTRVLIVDAPTFAALDPVLQKYLKQRMQRLSLERLRRLRQRNGALARLNRELIDALFAIRTQRGLGFAHTPAAQQLFAKVPSLPVSTLTLLNKMLDERTTKTEIVELVTMDPALTITLLKAANSPFYGFVHKVTNVSHAIVLLGHNTVYQIIMSESMRSSLPNTPFFAEMHQRAVEISRLAFALSQAINVGKPAEIATIGILGDIGLVVTELLKTYNQRLSILFDFLDPAEMGAELLRSWKLPEELCESLQYQSYPEFTPPERVPAEVRKNVALLYLARRFYQALHQTEEQPPGLFVKEYLAVLGQKDVTETDLFEDRLLPQLRTQMRQLPRSLVERLQV